MISFTFPADGSGVDLAATLPGEISLQQNQQGIGIGASIGLDVSCNLGPIDMAVCTAAASDYLCVYVGQQPQTGSFHDTTFTNNLQCIAMSSGKICSPGTHVYSC